MSHDKANQGGVGEGPKAVAIENLGELDSEYVFDKQVRAALANIDKLAWIDPEAADAAVQCLRRAREAREVGDAKTALSEIENVKALLGNLELGGDAAVQHLGRTREAREAGEGEAALSEIENVEALLSDLELGADTGAAEVIETIGELDAAAEGSVEAAIAPAEAYEAQDVLDKAHKEPNKLRELVRAKLVEIKGDDPFAKDKQKVSKALKKVGRSLADLPPDFWKLPRIAKIPGDRSRQSELYRICAEGEEKMHEAEHLRELEKRGLPANYDLLPRDEQDRINVNARQQRHRDKKRKPLSKPTVAPLPVADIAPDMLRHTLAVMLRSLKKWAAYSSAPRARQLREPAQQRALIKAAAAYARYFNQHDERPSHAELAKWLRCSEDQARRRLDRLKSLYEPGGPWASA